MKTNSAALIVPAPPATPDTNDIRGLKPPVPIPAQWAWLWGTLAALALAALAGWLWRRRRKRPPLAPATPPVPAHVRARQRLHDAYALLSEPHRFCFAVSNAIRWYLEERFDFHAPERTTEEFLSELQHSTLLTADQKATLENFLGRCDLVKFARYEPTETELRELHRAALRLVDETEPLSYQPEAAAAPVTA
ncbi:MAG: LPXTG cell wall anchor domain-containing protein [Verrucomicrobia bacterium]|nr:LPXTG cell wall anchor domain-containing protein [Verrucomicrobiota bacterium]